MTELEKIKEVYFIGIGGIGMSALARYFAFHGKKVSGYDKTETPLTRQLVTEGIAVHYEDNVDLVPAHADIVVYTPAIPADHRELNFFKDKGYPLWKRSDVLGLITKSSFNICVAGTHGKTTITTMVAHILRHSGYGCNAFLGGIAVNYNTNFWSDQRNVCVVEADEYDRSFLKLTPDIALITAMDADHLDIYGTPEAMEQAFIEFTGKVKAGGLVLHKKGLDRSPELKGSRKKTYSRTSFDADYKAGNIQMESGSYRFEVTGGNWTLSDIVLNMGGAHNVENVTAAIAVAHELGIEDEKIKAAVEAFRGVKRRFEYIVKRKDLVFVDDYAHHPEELRALISGARELFPQMKCTVIFQPHLFTRTRDLADGFAGSLDLADEVVLLPIYPAREKPIEGVNSEMILERMKKTHKQIKEKTELLDWIRKMGGERSQFSNTLLITAGAGDIDTLVQPVREVLES